MLYNVLILKIYIFFKLPKNSLEWHSHVSHVWSTLSYTSPKVKTIAMNNDTQDLHFYCINFVLHASKLFKTFYSSNISCCFISLFLCHLLNLPPGMTFTYPEKAKTLFSIKRNHGSLKKRLISDLEQGNH